MLSALAAVPSGKAALFQQGTAPSQKNDSPPAAGAANRVPPEQLREDFLILRRALEEGHPGIYRYTTRTELDKRFEEAEKALDRPMTVYEFYRIVAPVVAAIKCGHTGVRVNPDLAKGSLMLVKR
jgi:hypothetical protein